MRIQLVSEANLVHSALVYLLKGEADFIVLGPVECSPPCHRACCTSESDVLILDTISGSNNGVHCLKQIISRHPEKKVLILIPKQHYSQTNELLKNGAMGVISLDIDPAQFTQAVRRDRKSTRLNSSHITTSYAVFCLKKKTSPNPAEN